MALFQACCETCLTSMSSDLDGEIQAALYHNETYEQFKDRFQVLEPDSAEYKVIKDRFHSSVQNEIIRIEVHYNPHLLQKYEEYKAKHSSTDGEKLLFHGSRHANYLSILNDGFDISRSKDGLQGCGVYFATNASYSISGFAETIMLEGTEGQDLYKVGNMLCCQVYPTSDTGKRDNNYCIRNAEQCYPKYIVYYKS